MRAGQEDDDIPENGGNGITNDPEERSDGVANSGHQVREAISNGGEDASDRTMVFDVSKGNG